MPYPDTAAVILAGGLARRMGGGDKGLLAVGGIPIIQRVIAIIRPQVGALVLNANGDPARFQSLGLPVVPDSVPDFAGPLAGVLAGLDALPPGCRWLLSVPSDTPFLPADLASRLHAAVTGADIACARSDGRRHPVAALWPAGLAPALRHALTVEGVRKMEAFTQHYRVALADFPIDPVDPFFNANTPEDLAEAERLLALTRLAPGRGGGGDRR
ncbi:MAG TPA: molybdenum cofactor guanylyltransferase MobA [Azospirillaceae bacterium]|nr:molybdenum cofactor guanylyltransferase MobA [Azospirillaceae bacterium]